MCHNFTGDIENNEEAVDTIDTGDIEHNEVAIDTVENSKKNFTKRDQLRVHRVRRFQHVAAHPSDETIIYSSMTNGIRNNPITKRDVKMALEMLGRSRYSIQGKTVRRKPDTVTA